MSNLWVYELLGAFYTHRTAQNRSKMLTIRVIRRTAWSESRREALRSSPYPI